MSLDSCRRDGGETLVGQPAKKLLFSRNATAVTGHTLLLGLKFDSEEWQVEPRHTPRRTHRELRVERCK